MQCSTGNVFQELQQQGAAAQEGDRRTEGRTEAGGSRRSDPRISPPAPLAASPSFFPEDSTHAQSPSPAFLSDSAGASRYWETEASRGRQGTLVGSQSSSKISTGGPTRVRPPDRPGAPGSPFGPSAGETVPSQLLGGRVGADADVHLILELMTEAASPHAGPKSILRKSTASEHLRQVPDSAIISRQQGSLAPPESSNYSPPHTPSPGETNSTSSKQSNASSFAYRLRDNRKDRRLFKRRSKPSEHLRKQPSEEKQHTKLRHSASFYRPKVVEDSAAADVPAPSKANALVPSQQHHGVTISTSPVIAPIRKADSSPNRAGQPLKIALSPLSLAAKRLGALGSPPSLEILPAALSKPPRDAETSTSSSTHRRDSSQDRQQDASDGGRSRESSSSVIHKRWNDFNAPPEGEPRTPFDSLNKHGDDYFRTFGSDTIYQKEKRASISSPQADSVPKRIQFVDAPSSSSLTPNTPSDSSVSVKTTRKHDSVLKMLQSGVLGNRTSAQAGSPRSDTSTSSKGTPDIKISAPYLANSRRRSNTGSEYFPLPSQSRASSECTPMSPASGLSTHWEAVVAESQGPGHIKDMSEPLSPLTVPSSPVRPKPKRTSGEYKVLQTVKDLAEDSVVPGAPSGAVSGQQQRYKSATGEVYNKTSLTDPGAPNFLPSEMKRISTPPQNEKTRGFDGFFFNMRSIPESAVAESSEPKTMKRRLPVIHKGSLQALLPKLSVPKLKRKTSQHDRVEPKAVEDPLEVTAFHQTPYTQRYGDARRAKMSQIRSYVEETLKDDDDDELANLAFELDVPDHLPNSPLCPISPKHGSGRKAICPIHRRKRTSVAMGKGLARKATAKPEPRIVYESESPGDVRTPEDLDESPRGGS